MKTSTIILIGLGVVAIALIMSGGNKGNDKTAAPPQSGGVGLADLTLGVNRLAALANWSNPQTPNANGSGVSGESQSGRAVLTNGGSSFRFNY